MNPEDLKYTKDHEWVRSLDGRRVAIGITDFAQKQLGDVVYVELPSVDDRREASEPFGSVESVKAVTEVYMPLTGTIAAVNTDLDDSPENVNTDPYGDGWMIEVTLAEGENMTNLLTAHEYDEYIKAESAD
ncbi:glycine cleavage system protein GcvH [Embleya scabrispora]|uniref:glycine cleavage system protein GcvH n=1 Tax=Embleya scabrispora TaxID=159449 RepID=UPI0003A8897B|nr:glycine cleavage system protein GcvH [Embleya scabrispora]MYS86179.1 glycine cleavage system protein GcvH [Streptomyces sp. SID5474]